MYPAAPTLHMYMLGCARAAHVYSVNLVPHIYIYIYAALTQTKVVKFDATRLHMRPCTYDYDARQLKWYIHGARANRYSLRRVRKLESLKYTGGNNIKSTIQTHKHVYFVEVDHSNICIHLTCLHFRSWAIFPSC